MVKNKLSRRDFLRTSTMAGVGLMLVACAPAAPGAAPAAEGGGGCCAIRRCDNDPFYVARWRREQC